MWIVIKKYVNIWGYTIHFYFTKVYKKTTYFIWESTKNVIVTSITGNYFLFHSEIHCPIFYGPWMILSWVSEKSRRLFTVVFCGLLSFICSNLSQELDKKHWPRIFAIIPPYFLIDVDILSDKAPKGPICFNRLVAKKKLVSKLLVTEKWSLSSLSIYAS